MSIRFFDCGVAVRGVSVVSRMRPYRETRRVSLEDVHSYGRFYHYDFKLYRPSIV